MEKDNATLVLTRFIKALAIPVTRQSISDELQKHPDYGSMLAFNDVLNNYRVTSDAYLVPFKELAEVPLPFIAHLADKDFAVVTRLDEQQVTLSNEKWNNKKIPLDKFKKLYANTVLTAQKQPNAGEPGYAGKHRKELISDWGTTIAGTGTAIILLAFLLMNTGYLTAFSLQIALLTLFKTAGLAVSILLLVQSIDANNPLIQKLCGDDDTKNCNAILSSKAAKATEWLSWSEVGFFYFAGTLLTLLFNSGHIAIMQALAILNIISLPYTVYSIYYQWRVAKQWCVFCCAVQAILWLGFFAFLPYLLNGLQTPSLTEWATLTMGIMLPVFAWVVLKPYLLQYARLTPLNNNLRHFKYNKELFDAAVMGQPKFATPGADYSIVLGNAEANNIITMISNPYCQPCAKAHAQIDEALNNFEDMQVRIIFVGKSNTDENNTKTKVHRHLMALNELADRAIIKNALHDWYEQKQKNYDAWAKVYPVTLNPENNYKLDKQKAWCDMAGISGTPTFLINGYRLPKTYQLHELKYMLYNSDKEASTESKEEYAL